LAWALLAYVYRRAGDGAAMAGRDWLLVLGAAAAFFAPAAALAYFTGPELPTLGGAILGALLFGFVSGRKGGGPPMRALIRGMLPYLAIIVLILATRLVPALRDLLRGWTLEWTLFGSFRGSVAPLFQPGTMLVAGLLIAALTLRGGAALVPVAAGAALRRLPRVALALISVLLLARLMVHSGMVGLIAPSGAEMLGPAWPVAAPLVGAVGSFITGSATASNILFADLQYALASAAELAPLPVMAGQGFGAAIGNIVAPHNIVAGAATVGLVGAEGKVLRRTLPICILYALAGGLLLLAAGVGFSDSP
ncbi:MAG: L-lactate permease, partial [Allosphingosinicella sp.]